MQHSGNFIPDQRSVIKADGDTGLDRLHEKYGKLITDLKKAGRVAVAYSAGVDSTFLLKTAYNALGGNVLAITGRAVSFPAREITQSAEFCRLLGVEQVFADVDQLLIDGFCENPADRCYLCKKALFSAFREAAEAKGFSYIADGSNADDDNDYRPGMKALQELGIVSPLKDAGLTKADIRILSRELDLPTWDRPSFACLATRFPYGEKITEEKLHKVNEAEELMLELGFRQVRVRMHGNIARIEISPDQFGMIIAPDIRESVIRQFKELGFIYVTLDLGGYMTGSMNLEIL